MAKDLKRILGLATSSAATLLKKEMASLNSHEEPIKSFLVTVEGEESSAALFIGFDLSVPRRVREQAVMQQVQGSEAFVFVTFGKVAPEQEVVLWSGFPDGSWTSYMRGSLTRQPDTLELTELEPWAPPDERGPDEDSYEKLIDFAPIRAAARVPRKMHEVAEEAGYPDAGEMPRHLYTLPVLSNRTNQETLPSSNDEFLDALVEGAVSLLDNELYEDGQDPRYFFILGIDDEVPVLWREGIPPSLTRAASWERATALFQEHEATGYVFIDLTKPRKDGQQTAKLIAQSRQGAEIRMRSVFNHGQGQLMRDHLLKAEAGAL